MKKSKSFVILIFILVLALSMLIFFGCDKKDDIKDSVTITFVTNDPNIKIDPITITKDSESTMPVNPDKAGYTFLGWYYDKECTRLFSVEDAITDDITLYAKWKSNNQQSEDDIDTPIYVESGSFSYEEKNGEYIITAYKGTDSEIVIPDSYNKKPVTEIKDYAFKNNNYIEKVTIGSVLEQIGEGAFENCKYLKEINVVGGSDYYSSIDGILYNRDKNSIIQIGMAKDIYSFIISKNVNIIRKGAFYGTQFEVSFEEEGEYNTIEEYDFYGFDGVLYLNSNITAIEENAFYLCKGKIIFEESNNITNITMGAFNGFCGEKIILSNKITKISEYAFANCSAIVDISNTSIEEITKNAFNNYTGESLVIPSSVTKIGENAFYNSTTSITFATGSQFEILSYLSFGRFRGKVYLPESAKIVENYAFWEICPEAEIYFSVSRNQITVDEDYENFDSIENLIFND